MLGFAPLAAIPLAASAAISSATPTTMSATGGITFGGSANLEVGGRLVLSATGGITFGGSAVPLVNIYRSTAGASIQFGGSPLLRLAGRPIVITAMPDSMIVRAEKVSFEFSAVPESLTLRWWK